MDVLKGVDDLVADGVIMLDDVVDNEKDLSFTIACFIVSVIGYNFLCNKITPIPPSLSTDAPLVFPLLCKMHHFFCTLFR